jgi:GrpB-like predicted nucleotidyltransferase (UPF0157 family)
MQRQIRVFELLRDRPDLLVEYEKLKWQLKGQSFRIYQKAKYEFYNRILQVK